MIHDNTLPHSWVECKLGDVVNYGITKKVEPEEIPASAWVIELEDIESNTSKILQYSTSSERQPKSTKNRFLTGDILYGKLRPYLNKVIRADKDGYCTTEIIPLTPPHGLEGKYLFYWLKSPFFINYVLSVSHGLSMPRLGTEAGKRAPFVLAPLNEQKRIVNKLNGIFKHVDNCRESLGRIPAILGKFRQSVLMAAISGRLTEEWRLEVNSHMDNSSEWQSVSIGSLCQESFYGPRFGRDKYTNLDTGVPTIRTTDMSVDGRIIISDETPRVIVSEDKIEHFRLRKGDLLITRTGSIGTMAVFEEDYLAIPSAYLIRFRFLPNVYARFIFITLSAPYGQEQLGLLSGGTTQSNINVEAIKRIKIQLPTLVEQHEIVRRVESLFAFADRIEARHKAAHSQLERLIPSILNKAFNGQLVPQDLKDESASHLLENIRTVLANQAKQPKKSLVKSIKRKKHVVMKKIVDVLAEAGNWLQDDEVFRRCGVSSISTIDELEKLYAELRELDKAGRLEAEEVRDSNNRKWHDRFRLKR